ncbi:Glutamyl-tRNA(Gln) amidotransferase subunit A, mitochondrial [Hypsizygus marmoreus]|uniref:Glutamyl-tRNA(Gln) amidotransferase subunit A, mitochondrial n=1 Tax=Hypsizygus marmoreus TaxID=39966 RepID=A0A369JGA1_HYPMA|nr:Glutamyl-tRNA(Gln) amidotransferase subunit A, mitochondrial [Hypsizygus marmoreus]
MRPPKSWASLRIHRRLISTTTTTDARTRIAAHNAHINAFVCTSDPPPTTNENIDTGGLVLGGKPVAVKASICTMDMGTSCSSGMLRDFTSPYDATVVRLLRAAGADIVGKTNCDEFGMGSLNVHSIHGPVVNPYTPPPPSQLLPVLSSLFLRRRSPGGSSGGSAAAVAAGMCYAALGTDTGGSTRLPASYCGVVGLKPSYGLLSRWGVVSFADSLDCVGVLAGTVFDVKRVFNVLNVYDAKDPTASTPEARRRAGEACSNRLHNLGLSTGSLHGLRVGIPQEYFPEELTPAILRPLRRTLAALRKKGATIVPVSMPATSYALSAYYVLASAEASSCLARFDGVEYGLNVRPPPGTDIASSSVGALYAHTRSAAFGQEVQRRILLGTYALSADAFDNYFLQAQRVRQLVKDDFNRVFAAPNFQYSDTGGVGSDDGVDVLIHPSAIQTAPLLDAGPDVDGQGQEYVQDVLTVPASLAGVPGLSVPMKVGAEGDGWPVGVSIIGQWGCEEMVFAVGQAVEGLGGDTS